MMLMMSKQLNEERVEEKQSKLKIRQKLIDLEHSEAFKIIFNIDYWCSYTEN